MEEKKPPRREREKQAQRQEMLDAALELFSNKGYRNVSMHEIAEKAEFAIGTLYNFFKNKEDLYKALISEQSNKFSIALTKAITEPEQEIEKLRSFVKTKGEVFRNNAPMIRLYFAETQGANINAMVGLNAEIKERHRNFLHALAAIFESGIKKKRFKKIADPFYLAMALDSFTSACLFLWLEEPAGHPAIDDPDTILNVFFKGLISE